MLHNTLNLHAAAFRMILVSFRWIDIYKQSIPASEQELRRKIAGSDRSAKLSSMFDPTDEIKSELR